MEIPSLEICSSLMPDDGYAAFDNFRGRFRFRSEVHITREQNGISPSSEAWAHLKFERRTRLEPLQAGGRLQLKRMLRAPIPSLSGRHVGFIPREPVDKLRLNLVTTMIVATTISRGIRVARNATPHDSDRADIFLRNV